MPVALRTLKDVKRCARVAVASAGIVAFAASSQASEPASASPVTLVWRAPPGCPSEEDVAALREAGAFAAESPDERGFGDPRRSTGTEQGRLSDVDLSVGEYRVESVARDGRSGSQVLVTGLPTASKNSWKYSRNDRF